MCAAPQRSSTWQGSALCAPPNALVIRRRSDSLCSCVSTTAPSSPHRFSISYMATRTEWDKKRNCTLNAKVMRKLQPGTVPFRSPWTARVLNTCSGGRPIFAATVSADKS